MDTKKGKELLTEQDFNQQSIWIRHQSDDLLYPVYGPEDFPEDMAMEDLCVRATFSTQNGEIFHGYIVGLKNIYCIVIFFENKIFCMNKNLFDDCIEDIEQINGFLEKSIQPNEFFPLKYQTTIDIKEFKNFQGEFDIFKKMTDEERINRI